MRPGHPFSPPLGPSNELAALVVKEGWCTGLRWFYASSTNASFEASLVDRQCFHQSTDTVVGHVCACTSFHMKKKRQTSASSATNVGSKISLPNRTPGRPYGCGSGDPPQPISAGNQQSLPLKIGRIQKGFFIFQLATIPIFRSNLWVLGSVKVLPDFSGNENEREGSSSLQSWKLQSNGQLVLCW